MGAFVWMFINDAPCRVPPASGGLIQSAFVSRVPDNETVALELNTWSGYQTNRIVIARRKGEN
jgi:hypothetical protein